MESFDEEKYKRAKKRVESIKAFYVHLGIYLVVNIAILTVLYNATRSNGEPFWHFGHFFTLIFWGIGVLFHAFNTFNINPLFGRKWEERQISKYIEKDREESGKYK